MSAHNIEPILRDNMLTLARAYSKAKGTKFETLSRYCHGEKTFLHSLSQRSAGFTARKYCDVMEWFIDNWPESEPWPSTVWDPSESPAPFIVTEKRKLRAKA